MNSRWVERDASAMIERCARQSINGDIATCLYATRLLGADPALVLHGGGNTSVKTTLPDALGEATEVLCVKASGADMASIEPNGLPAVRLAPMRRLLQGHEAVADGDLLRIQRASLLDPMAPNPSVELMLHAALPHKFVDHTHASALLSVIDQPNAAELCAEVYDGRAGLVPYHRPGFGLAKLAAEVYAARPAVEALILAKHGIFTFADNARDAYERMIEFVTLAEERLRKNRKAVFRTAHLPQRVASPTQVAPVIRGACSLQDERVAGAYFRLVLAFRGGEAVLNFVNGEEVKRYGGAGVVTPDHTIRTKNWPLVLPAPDAGKPETFKPAVQAAVGAFVEDYKAYFARNNARVGDGMTMLDPLPRVVLLPGLGLFGLGPTARDARIAADIAEAAIATITDAEAIGRFQSISEDDMFDCEYWPLELAKLGETEGKPLIGQIAVITGAGGAIGGATAQVFAAAGAEVALLDVNEAAAQEKARAIGGAALAVHCDVTDAASVKAAFERVVEAFGGLDIVVSNAGAAWQGRIGEVDEAILRESFELNFFGHQRVAQQAVKVMLAQGTGGCLLFNISKQAVNPGPNFGPYGLPKAATLFLVRQYALDYGAEGIRANAVNADRIRSGLLTDDFVRARSAARGVSEQDYMSGNLLHREVTAEDVAQAFLHQALALKTTADVTTVDGGNIAAALR